MFKDNKKLVVETIFISEALKLDLSLKEFLVLLYFDNIYDEVFDMKIVAKTLNMKEEDVLTAYGSLVTKNLIKVNAEKDCFGKIREKVCLDNFYNEIKNDYKTKEKEDPGKERRTAYRVPYWDPCGGQRTGCGIFHGKCSGRSLERNGKGLWGRRGFYRGIKRNGEKTESEPEPGIFVGRFRKKKRHGGY